MLAGGWWSAGRSTSWHSSVTSRPSTNQLLSVQVMALMCSQTRTSASCRVFMPLGYVLQKDKQRFCKKAACNRPCAKTFPGLKEFRAGSTSARTLRHVLYNASGAATFQNFCSPVYKSKHSVLNGQLGGERTLVLRIQRRRNATRQAWSISPRPTAT